jgi:hypothetical protein
VKRGGLALVVLVILTGALRFGMPGTGTPGASAGDSSAKQYHKPDKEKLSENPKQPDTELGARKIAQLIGQFYGSDTEGNFCKNLPKPNGRKTPAACSQDLQVHWLVPPDEREQIRFVIALTADPKHTLNGLIFDHEIESIQRAAQEEGYDFDSAVMPWRDPSVAIPTTLEAQLSKNDRENEQYPGLMIFREGTSLLPIANPKDPNGWRKRSPLFVLVVGERSTAGINKAQFENAISIIRAIRVGTDDPNPNLLLLGPTFSGSLYSLNELLRREIDYSKIAKVLVYSGTVRGTAAGSWFVQAMPKNTEFAAFQENEEDVLNQFALFACQSLGIDDKDIAVLSEDETAYGRSPEPANAPPSNKSNNQTCSDQPGLSRAFHLQFPRGISEMRVAYQTEILGATDSRNNASFQSEITLHLDLNTTGEDDTVTTYAKSQMPLSQEATMLDIVSFLHQLHSKLVVLRATDPLDQLFLTKYLREHYPEGRVVVVAPDLLLAREQDGLLFGTAGINAYPLVLEEEASLVRYVLNSDPLLENPSLRSEKIFASSSDAGEYNAMVALSQEAKPASLQPKRNPGELLPAQYALYRSPSAGQVDATKPIQPRPGVWLSVLGRDGFWAVAGFDPDKGSTLHAVAQNRSKQANNENLRLPLNTAWEMTYLILVAGLFSHVYLCWTGTILLPRSDIFSVYGIVEQAPPPNNSKLGFFPDRRRRACLLALGTLLLTACPLVLACAWYGGMEHRGSLFTVVVLYIGLPLMACMASVVEIWVRRFEPFIAILTALVAGLFTAAVLSPTRWFPQISTLLCDRRILHIASGVSPIPPVLFLFGGALCAVWSELRGMALVDVRRPKLPPKPLPREFDRLSDVDGERIRTVMRPFYIPWRTKFFLLGMVVTLVALFGWNRRVIPVHTLEGTNYDATFSTLLGILLMIFVGCLGKLWDTWNECQVILAALDRNPLRDAFSRLKEFSWGFLWSVRGASLRDSYKFLSRELEGMNRIERALPAHFTDIGSEPFKQVNAAAVLAQQALALVHICYAEATKDEEKVPELLEALALLQERLGTLANRLIEHVLVPRWNKDLVPVASSLPRDQVPSRTVFERLAEEFVSFVYANFLVTVLLRMRTIVVGAIGIYVFILLSISSYPFSPSPTIFILAVLLLVMLLSAVGSVYAQMHREATLSRLTDTREGTLGGEFWAHFVSAGSIPIVTLLAAQFPAISRMANSLLQPFLQSVK